MGSLYQYDSYHLLLDLTEDIRNYLADNALNGIVGWLYNLYVEASGGMAIVYTERFSPDVSTFIEYVGEQTHYMEYMSTLASTLALGIFVFYLVLVGLKKIRLADIQETLPTLVGRLVLVFIGISYSAVISDALFSTMNSAYNTLQTYGFDTSIDFIEALLKLAIPISLANLMTVNNILICILCVIFGLIFIKQFINLMLEVIERYIVACLLKYSFPLPLATCVTKNTSAVFKKYLQMYLCQLLMLILNTIMVNMVLRMVNKVDTMETIVGWMFMFAFIKVCQRIDNYLFTMGMSVAVTGGNVMDQAGQTFRGMVQTARMGSYVAGGAASAGASALKNAATADGIDPSAQNGMLKTAFTLDKLANVSRGNFGNALKPNTVENTIKDLSSSLGSDHAMNFAKNVTPEQIDASMIAGVQSANKSALGIYNTFSEDTKRAIANQSHNLAAFVPKGAVVDNIEFGMNGSMKGRMSYQDAAGMHSSDFEISRTATNKSMHEDSGFYFSSSGGMNTGETIAYSNDNNGSISSAEILMGKTLDNVSSSVLDNTQSITRTDDGFVLSKGVNNDNADILAKVTDKGEIFYNQGTTLTSEQLQNRPWAKDLADVRMHNNGDGTIDVIGKHIKSHGSEKDQFEFRNFRLYNRALFDDKNAMNVDKAKYVGSFNAHENSGAFMVGEIPINKKDDSALASISNRWEDYSSTIDASITDGFKI